MTTNNQTRRSSGLSCRPAGPKRGAIVEAKIGQGRWIYLGLGLWRQLPAGTDGAYRLMANLISLGGRAAATPGK
jgi:hypothetical protein